VWRSGWRQTRLLGGDRRTIGFGILGCGNFVGYVGGALGPICGSSVFGVRI